MREIIRNGEQMRLVREKLNATLNPFGSRAEFESSVVPSAVIMVYVIEGGDVYRLLRDESGDWTDGGGSKWAASIEATIPGGSADASAQAAALSAAAAAQSAFAAGNSSEAAVSAAGSAASSVSIIAALIEGIVTEQPGQFATRAAAVSAATSMTWTVGALINDGTVSYRYDGVSSAIADMPGWSPNGHASPWHFGAVLDGLADDTGAIRALHDWCNLNGVAPSYRGVETFAIQANAGIQISTNVDFCGAKIKAIGGIVGVPSFASITDMFLVSDPDAPLQTGTVAVTDGNLARGSRTPTADFWTQPGYVYMSGADVLTSPMIVNRETDGLLTYRQSFKVVKSGVVVHPLARSMVGAGTVYYRARANSASGWLEIKNFVIDASTINNCIVFQVERNQVKVSDWAVAFTGTLPASINSMVFFKDCCDGIVQNVTAPAMTSFSSNGTYLIQTDYAAEITLDNIQALNGWGATGTNLTSGLYFRDCRLNRVDAHFMCFNMFVDGCVIAETGVVFGCGGGAMSIRNSRFLECAVLSSRQDYGGYWFGDCVISDVTIERHNSATAPIIDMETNPVGFTASGLASLPLFDTIRISGVHRVGYTGTAYIAGVRLKVKSGSEGKLVAPLSVNLDGISGAASVGWSFFNTFDLLNMTQGARVDVNMSNIHPSRAMSLSNFDSGLHMLRMWAKVGAHATPDLNVTLHNVSQPAVDLSAHTGAPRLELHSCRSIRRAVGGAGGRCVITGGTLDTPTLSGAETKGQIGNTGTSGTYNIVALIGTEVAGAWDFSRCNHMAGNVWTASQDASMVFPAGVTWAIQAAGWRA